MKTLLQRAKKLLKGIGIFIAAVLLLLYLIPVLFPGQIENRVKKWANAHLDARLDFSKTRLSFFAHFPALTVSLYDFSMTGSRPFQQQPLVKARELAFGIDLSSLIFKSQTHIDEIYLSGADMQVRINEKGEANYNVYKSDTSKKNTETSDSSGAAIKLEKIELEDSRLLYEDASLGMLIHAKQLDYSGSGNLDQAVFDLDSHISTDSLDFAFGGDTLLRHKRIDADLITRINTHTLTFLFRENKLRINRLPLQFTGSLVFRNDGYGLDFDVATHEARLYDLITALPSELTPWLEATRVKGTADFRFQLKGDYIASREILPSVFFDLQVKDGFIRHQDAPAAIEKLNLNFTAELPRGNTDSLMLKIEPMHFELAGGSMDLNAQIQNLYQPRIHARVVSKLNLELFDQAAGLPQLDMKGDAFLNLNASGVFSTVSVTRNRKPVTEITSVPSFQGTAGIENGWIKFNGFPEAISNIQLKLNAGLKNSDYRNIAIDLSRFSATVGKGRVNGHTKISGLERPDVDAAWNIQMNLADFNNALPVKSIQLSGNLLADIKAHGIWNPEKRQLPVVDTRISWKRGAIQTTYYPQPIQQIDLDARVTGQAGDLKSMRMELQPASFQFENQPFSLKMLLDNFEDIGYTIDAKGTLDLGRIYRVFALDGMNISGLLKTDLSLKGRQSDALAGRYNKLQNKGTLHLDHVLASTNYFPKPFLIESGTLRFNQDKVWMNDFTARYGASDFRLNGSMSQFIEYLFSGGIIKGHFDIRSNLIDADAFMYHAPSDTLTSTQPKIADSTAMGVIVFPPEWDFSGTLQAKHLLINGIQLDQARATTALKDGVLSFKETGFKLAGARVTMDGSYSGQNPEKGWFKYHLKADSFDVQRAYKEIQLFREMATSAGKVHGLIGLDYALEGELNNQMVPVLPSLKGGGELQLQQVKVKGLKLLGEVSRKTGRDSLRNPDLSKVTIKSRLANTILTIDRFKMKMFGFRLRCEGQTSLDGRLKLKMRLGLPPLGIFGIPMNVTGSQENPRVRLGRGTADSLQAEPSGTE